MSGGKDQQSDVGLVRAEQAELDEQDAAASAVDALDRTTRTKFVKEWIARRETLVESLLQLVNGLAQIGLGALLGFKLWSWSAGGFVVVVVLGIAAYWVRSLRQSVLARIRAQRDDARRALADLRRTAGRSPGPAPAFRVLRELHKSWFPGPRHAQGLNQDYRLSLFVPEPNSAAARSWVCLAWTDTQRRKPPSSWEVRDRREIGQCGVVIYTYLEGTPVTIPGVLSEQRDERDPDACERYRRETCVSREKHDLRSWKWATLQTFFARGQTGAIACILVVERESGGPIEGEDPARRDRELQLVADLWAAVTEEPAHAEDQDPDPT